MLSPDGVSFSMTKVIQYYLPLANSLGGAVSLTWFVMPRWNAHLKCDSLPCLIGEMVQADEAGKPLTGLLHT
jgi:hypothetical protein